jgi:hypothetical protein
MHTRRGFRLRQVIRIIDGLAVDNELVAVLARHQEQRHLEVIVHAIHGLDGRVPLVEIADKKHFLRLRRLQREDDFVGFYPHRRADRRGKKQGQS